MNYISDIVRQETKFKALDTAKSVLPDGTPVEIIIEAAKKIEEYLKSK